MNVIGLTLNFVCLGFYIFLICLYFSKKNANNLDNKVYRYFLLAVFILIVGEISFLLTSYFTPYNTFLVGFCSRTKFFGLLMFFVILMYYVVLVATQNNKTWSAFINKHQLFINKSILFMLFIVAIFQYSLPMYFHYNSSGYIDYTYGLSTNELTSVVSAILLGTAIPTIAMNWKTVPKKRISPFFMITVLEIITLFINLWDLSLCFAAFSLTMSCYLMYFTIENPDLKMIAELKLAKSQAEKSNKAKSDFLSSMSHEIRTPLNAIVGLSQMIKENDDIESIHEDSEDIIVASQNLLELVNGILDINKIEANKIEIINGIYSPTKICDEVIKMIRVRIGEKPIELKTEYQPNVPLELYGDKEKIKQILTNLLTNAVKYTDKGSVTLKVESEFEKGNCNLIMSVIDTGRGIREDQKDLLFTKFYRLEEDKDTDIEGTGLGLAITKSLVDMFEGKIIVDSKYGEGSTFTVKIPQKLINQVDEQEKEEKEEKDTDLDNLNKNDLSTIQDENVKSTPIVVEDRDETVSSVEKQKETVEPVVEEQNTSTTNVGEEQNVNTVNSGEEQTSSYEKAQEVQTTNPVKNQEVSQNPQESNLGVSPSQNPQTEPVASTTPTSMQSPQTEQVTNNPQTSSMQSPQDVRKVLLVVDDNKLNLRVASKILQEFNFEIETVQSGFECIEKIENNNKYALIFMDIMMPKMNGVETMQKLKSMEGFDIPVIALTADAMEGSREKYLSEGFDEYLSKPINKELMGETISKYIKI